MDWSSIASLGGGLVTGLIGLFANNDTNATNEANVARTNRANAALAREANDLQVQLQREQNAFAHDEAELAFQREMQKMEYNNPINQLQRYQEAGVNPSVAFAGGTGAATAGNMTAPQAQPASSGVSPSLPNLLSFQKPLPFNLAGGMMDSVVKAATAIKSFKDAQKSSAEAKQIEAFLNTNLRKMLAETEGQELQNFLNANFGEKKESATVALLTQQAITAATQGDLNEATKVVKQSEDFLNKQLAAYHGQNAALLEKRNETYMKELKATIDNLYASSAAHLASAEASRAQADYSRQALLTSAAEREKFAQETLQAIESTRSISLDNEKRELLLPLIIKQIELDIRQQGQDYWNPFRYAGTIFGGAAGATIKAIAK